MRRNAQARRQVKEQLWPSNRYTGMRDYDKPSTPANTPPAIDPDVKPKTSAEMESEGEREDGILEHKSDEAEIEVERALGDAQQGGRDGAGEAALDTLPPD